MAQLDVDTDLANHRNLGQGELGGNLVGGDAQCIESPGQVARLEDDHVVSQLPQLIDDV